MAYINNWFHLYETEENFNLNKERGLINPNSICFIEETGQIGTQNSLFAINKKDYSQLKELVENHNKILKNILGTEGEEVEDGIINTLSDFKKFLDGFSEDDNLKHIIDTLEANLSTQIDNVEDSLTAEITELNSKVSKDYDSLLNNISTLSEELDTANSDINNNIASISNIREAIAAHSIEYATLKNSFDTFKSYTEGEFASIDSTITTLSNSLDKVKTDIETLNTTFTTKIDSIKSDISDIKNDISGISTDVSTIKVDLNSTNTKVKNLTDIVDSNKTQSEEKATELNQKIDTVKTDITNELDAHIALIGAANGITPLDGNSKVPAAYLPSYVDDVLEFENKESFPTNGESGKIYTAIDTNKTYRWSGTTYTELSKSIGLGETSSTAYPGNLGKTTTEALASHKSNQDNPHNVTKAQIGLGDVNNTSDINKPVSTAQATAIKVVQDDLTGHKNNKANPHEVTKTQIGLGNVDNTADLDKPISKATQAALNVLDTSLDTHIADKTNPHNVTKEQLGLGNVTNDAQVKKSEVGAPNGVAPLDNDSRVSTINLPYSSLNSDGIISSSDFRDFIAGMAIARNIQGDIVISLYKRDSTSREVIIPLADHYVSGLMTPAANIKLDSIESGAQVNTITGVKGNAEATYRTGKVNITPTNIGLGNVNNTSDADKPISKAVQEALYSKLDTVTADYTYVLNNSVFSVNGPADMDGGTYTIGASYGIGTINTMRGYQQVLSLSVNVSGYKLDENGSVLDNQYVHLFLNPGAHISHSRNIITVPPGYDVLVGYWQLASYMWIDGVHMIAFIPCKPTDNSEITENTVLIKELPMSRLSIQSQAEYDAITNKDAKTLYVVP